MQQFARADLAAIDFDAVRDNTESVYSRALAFEAVLGFISRAAMQTEFKIVSPDGKIIRDERTYRLNHKPNVNQTAGEFWLEAFRRLLEDGELLIVQAPNSDGLLIAEDYEHIELALKPDKFKDVLVRGFQFGQTFTRDEVIFVKYRSEDVKKQLTYLYNDYGSLYKQLIEFQRIKNQLRGTVDVETMMMKTADGQKSLQGFINKLYKSFSTGSVAIVPQQKGFQYTEHSRPQTGTGQSVDEITKIQNGYTSAVAEAYGLPPALLRGENVENERQVQLFLKFTLDPLLKLVTDDLKGGLLTKKEIMEGYTIETNRVSYRDVFELADKVEKLISSRALTPNQVLRLLGFEPSDDPKMNEHYMTKNFAETVEGGDETK